MPKTYFGNILIVYNASDDLLLQVEALILSSNQKYERFENSFFIRTETKKLTRELVAQIQALGPEYFFYHNVYPQASYFQSVGISDHSVSEIDKILINR